MQSEVVLTMKIMQKLLLVAAVAASSPVYAQSGNLVLKNAHVITSPTEPAQDNATVLVQNGTIVAVGPELAVRVPEGTPALDCTGKTIVAGFWNSHVHFTESAWDNAERADRDKMTAHAQQMLNRWGFTTVWDLGSDPDNTRHLQLLMNNGQVSGPRILMAGAMYPKGGHPEYVPKSIFLPEVGSPHAAASLAKRFLGKDFHDDGIKLFTGAYMGEDKPVINMPADVAKAAVDVAHEKGKPVFAHPQNIAGVDNALAAGVDVLAHTVPKEQQFTPQELARMKAQKTALVPTLALWHSVMQQAKVPPAFEEQFIQRGVDQLHAFFAQGGTVLFGTDVGFQQEYDTTRELELMSHAFDPKQGWKEVLASLTTNPCDYFKQENCGRIAPGMNADIVVLQGDPAADVRNLAKVAYTIRDGRVIYGGK
jgi:imidazolonepropionase-like amidohydrolase